jgi:hypothetical protein
MMEGMAATVQRLVVAAVLLLALGTSVLAQHRERQQTPAPATTGAATVDPDVEKFKRIVDLQATEDQERKFHGMTASTELARQRTRELQQQLEAAGDIIDVMHRATTLEDDVDQALTDYRIFRRSLADQQEVELKKQMKKVITSVHAISQDAATMSQVLDRVPVNTAKLRSLAEHMEKELGALQSAQNNVGKEMSIQVE